MAKTTSDSVVATRRKLDLMFMALLSLCISVKAEANFTLWVTRRSNEDIYQLNQSVSMTRIMKCAPNTSHIVNEKQCVSDEELFYGMKFNVDGNYNLIVIMIFDSIRMQYCNCSYELNISHTYCCY